MKRFHAALHPWRYHSVPHLVNTYKAICILHNMCVESKCRNSLSRLRRAATSDGGTTCGRGGDVGDRLGGGEGKSGGAPAGGTASTGALAPGGGSTGGVGGGTAAAGASVSGGGVGGVAAAMDKTDPVGNASPALNPAANPPSAGMASMLHAWAETQNVQEN